MIRKVVAMLVIANPLAESLHFEPMSYPLVVS